MADVSTTPTSNLAPLFGDYVGNMLGQAQGLGSLPFQPYEGDRYAGASNLQNQYFQGAANQQMPAQFGAATDAYQGILGGLQGQQNNPYQFNTPQINKTGMLDASNTGDISSFMNPYQQGVIDINKREAQRQGDFQNNANHAQAVKAGAFGGSRQGLQDAELQRNLGIQMNDIQTQGMNNAYTQAQTALNNQRAAGLQADTTNAQLSGQTQLNQSNANQAASQFGLNQAQIGSGIAAGLGNLGTAQQNAYQNQLSNLGTAGATQQAINQQPLDFGYQQWQDSLAYPQKQLAFQQGMLSGLPLSVDYNQQNDPFTTALNNGLGIYSLLNGGK